MKVAILLSTYNGEEFISEQIDSIIQQEFQDWVLYIRDDGSSDNTLSIIQKYVDWDNRITIMEDEVKHRGCRNSFLWLLKNVSADYYFFSDQDDVWLSDKISKSLNLLESLPSETPNLVVTDLILVDRNLQTIYQSMWISNHIDKLVRNPHNIKIAPLYTGCTMAFNELAKEQAIKNSFSAEFANILHDQVVVLSVYKARGNIKPLFCGSILYRQHDKNVIGAYAGSNFFLYKLKQIRQNLKDNKNYYNLSHKVLGTNILTFLSLKLRHILSALR